MFDGGDADFADLSFASGETGPEFSDYDAYHDFLLTNVDSFAADDAGQRLPGPVSQFYYAYPPPDPEPRGFDFEGSSVTMELDDENMEATQILIEREARLFAAYGVERWDADAHWIEAWKRFYRVIYRDNVDRLEGLTADLEEHFRSAGVPREEIPARSSTGSRASRTPESEPFIASEACGGPAWRSGVAVAEGAARNRSAQT